MKEEILKYDLYKERGFYVKMTFLLFLFFLIPWVCIFITFILTYKSCGIEILPLESIFRLKKIKNPLK